MMNTVPLDRRQLRDFGFVLGGGIIGVFGIFLPWLYHSAFSLWVWLLGGGFILIGLGLPDILRPVYFGWERLGLVLGWINTRLILGILFFFVITPLGWLMRVLGKGLSVHLYRIDKPPRLPNHMERPF